MKNSAHSGAKAQTTAVGPDNAANDPHGDHQPRAVPSHHGIENLRGKGGDDSFPRDPAGLPAASPVTLIELSDGATFGKEILDLLEPVCTADTAECRLRNRRVVIRLTLP